MRVFRGKHWDALGRNVAADAACMRATHNARLRLINRGKRQRTFSSWHERTTTARQRVAGGSRKAERRRL